jgi:uncharacterized delta-60 repeat protein
MKRLFTSVICCLSFFNVFAQAGTLDPSFGGDGIGRLHIGPGHYWEAFDIAIQPDRKILLAGTDFPNHYSNSDWHLMLGRLNKNGTPDASFNQVGCLIDSFPGYTSAQVNCMALQEDGKIIVGGYAFNGNYTQKKLSLARYNADGSPDINFNSTGKVVTAIGIKDDEINDLTILPDGKILICGITVVGNREYMLIAKYNSDGTLDQTFNGIGSVTLPHIQNTQGSNEGANALTVQNDGKIILGGFSQDANNYFVLVRCNSDGTLDNTFNNTGVNIIQCSSGGGAGKTLLLQNGDILASAISASTGYLMKFNTNGILDNTFCNGGIDTLPAGLGSFKPALQSDSKILVAGNTWASTRKITLIRINPNGSLDSSFDNDGIVTTALDTNASALNYGDNIALDTNRIYVCGALQEDTNINMVAVAYANDITLEVANSSNFYKTISNIYPNPAAYIVNITLPLSPANSSIIIYNAKAEAVRSLQLPPGATTTSVNIQALPPGIYNILCKQQDILSTGRFIKQ